MSRPDGKYSHYFCKLPSVFRLLDAPEAYPEARGQLETLVRHALAREFPLVWSRDSHSTIEAMAVDLAMQCAERVAHTTVTLFLGHKLCSHLIRL